MTTIITKNGSGKPPSLEVGELAIDKSEPALYTNTGSSIEKIAGGQSSGGGGEGFGVISSWPNGSSDWLTPANASLKITTSWADLINITGSGGYLLAVEYKKTLNQNQSLHCRITVDGKKIKDLDGSASGDNKLIIFWPPTIAHLDRGTASFGQGGVPPSFPLRFESSLRVQLRCSSGDAPRTNVNGLYVLA